MLIHRDELPKSFKIDMPEIYQVEVSSVCNYDCIMCPRNLYERKDKTPFIDINLVKKLVDEGAFEGSYFVELQMTGEPLLYPNIGDVIHLIKSTKAKVGLSTNGSLIHKKIDELSELDYMTISVDSISDYSSIRRKGNIDQLLSNIDIMRGTRTSIDLQVVELEGWEKEFAAVKRMFPDMYVRSINDCWLAIRFPVDELPVSTDICINPWMSVSIQSNGNVVPCCFNFWDDIIYGNVKYNTLKEIWEGKKVKALRKQHEEKKYSPICSKCYMRSPTFLHWNIFNKSIKGR